jgi:hypothetical protein
MTQNPYCIKCGSVLAQIAYGFPSPDLFDNPNFVLGGCVMEENQPEFFCKKCDVAVSNQDASGTFLSVGYIWYSATERRVKHAIKFTGAPNLSQCMILSPGDPEWVWLEDELELADWLAEFNAEESEVWQIGVDDNWVEGETGGQESWSNPAILSLWGDETISAAQLAECGTKLETKVGKPEWFDFNVGA